MTFYQDYKKVGAAKNLREFLDTVPEYWIEGLFAFPMIYLALSPAVIFLIRCRYPYYAYDFPIPGTMVILYALTLMLYLGKRRVSGQTIQFSLRENWPLVCYGLLVFWMLLSSLVNGTLGQMFQTSDKYQGSLYTNLLNYTMWFGCGWFVKNRRLKNLFLGCFLFSGAVLSVTTLIDQWVIPLKAFRMVYPEGWIWVQAIFNNPNYYSYYLVIQLTVSAWMFVLAKKSYAKCISLVLLILHTEVLLVNQSFGGYLAALVTLVIGVAVISIWQEKFIFFALTPLVVFLGVSLLHWLISSGTTSIPTPSIPGSASTVAEDKGVADRIRLWQFCLGYIQERPICGHGYDGILERLAQDIGYPDSAVRPHNEFLEYACFFGIPAMLLYIVGTLGIYLRALKNKCLLGGDSVLALLTSLAYLASSFVGCQIATIIPYLFIFLGIGCQLEKEP